MENVITNQFEGKEPSAGQEHSAGKKPVAQQEPTEQLFLGIDGGGTKCKAVLMSSNNDILGVGVSGPGNPVYGLEEAIQSIENSALMAVQDAGLDAKVLGDLIVGMGLAGVNVPSHYRNIMAWRHPFKNIHLATDLLIASMGAHNGSDGAVIVAGTGTCGFSYVAGKTSILGGHGFPQGDKGSGAWFGLKAIEQVLLTLDNIAGPTLLVELVLQQLNVKTGQEVVEQVVGKSASFFAQFSATVFTAANSQDKTAMDIVQEGAKYISEMGLRLIGTQPPRISLIGGLGPSLFPWLDDVIKGQLSQPISPPEVGAVLFAKQQSQLSSNVGLLRSAI
ncbi:N-acetylglucosamine kinase [Paraglaciecola arctica]|uniref:N-acetylglucosamine kinase n=1 Tax=Paraglaciecola arctica TaxID=1128911 RepID=UPI00339D461A